MTYLFSGKTYTDICFEKRDLYIHLHKKTHSTLFKMMGGGRGPILVLSM